MLFACVFFTSTNEPIGPQPKPVLYAVIVNAVRGLLDRKVSKEQSDFSLNIGRYKVKLQQEDKSTKNN